MHILFHQLTIAIFHSDVVHVYNRGGWSVGAASGRQTRCGASRGVGRGGGRGVTTEVDDGFHGQDIERTLCRGIVQIDRVRCQVRMLHRDTTTQKSHVVLNPRFSRTMPRQAGIDQIHPTSLVPHVLFNQQGRGWDRVKVGVLGRHSTAVGECKILPNAGVLKQYFHASNQGHATTFAQQKRCDGVVVLSPTVVHCFVVGNLQRKRRRRRGADSGGGR